MAIGIVVASAYSIRTNCFLRTIGCLPVNPGNLKFKFPYINTLNNLRVNSKSVA